MIKKATIKHYVRDIRRHFADRLTLHPTKQNRYKSLSRLSYRKRLNIAVTGFAIFALLIGLLLPAATARAEQTLSWTNNADFTYNKTSKCQATTIDKLVISGSNYTDATCAAVAAESDLTLAPDESDMQNIIAVSGGGAHSLALKNDGTVWAWGYNGYGQLGDNTTTNRNLPVQVKDAAGTGYLSGITAIAAGESHSLALKNDGTVWAWGYNGYGQLGDNTATSRSLPVQIKDSAGTGFLTGITAIATGDSHSLALKNDGTVWAWGYNNYGKLGDGTNQQRFRPVQVKDSAGTGYLGGITAVVAGYGHSMALKNDGTVWAWGYNTFGQLGNNTVTNSSLPVQVKDASGGSYLNSIAKIVTGRYSALVIKNDGTVWAWGYNSYGQLGDNTTTSRSLPIQVKDSAGTGLLTGITDIAAGGEGHSLALKNDGTVWAWGSNGNGQLGDNTTTSRNLPVQVKDTAGTGFLTGITAIAAGNIHSLALKNDGTVWAWGNNGNGQLGYRFYSSSAVTTPSAVVAQVDETALINVKTIAAGGSHSLALKNDGTVWAWGNNGYGQLGDNTTTQRNLPVQVKDTAGTGYLTGMTAVAASSGHSLALKNDGTVWAWGNNGSGQLGDNTTTQRNLPVQVKDAAGTGYLTGMTAVAAGSGHSLALKNDGTVWAWGYNGYGNLGDNTNTNRNLPVQVKDAAGTGNLTGITAIAAGFYHSLALKNDGTVWAWGSDNYGELGDGTASSRNHPVQVKDVAGTGNLTGITAIVAGGYYSIALKNDGTVWAWGNNGSGQLGTGNLKTAYYVVNVLSAVNYRTGFALSGSLSGSVVDVGLGKKTKWYSVDWQSDALPVNTSIAFNARTSNDGVTWSDWSSAFTQAATGSTTGTGDLGSLPLSRFLEVKATLTSPDHVATPKLNDFSVSFMKDTAPPITNASAPAMSLTSSSAPIAENSWINSQTPYFSWTDGADDTNGSGIQGYCLYLGQDNTADVTQTKGLLGSSPVDTGGACQYTVAANHLDLSMANILSTPLTLSNQPYYLLIKVIDQAANVYAGSAASYTFHYDDVPPNNPTFISAPSQFVATKDVTLTWPISGDQAASDNNSGIAGLQYKIGTGGTWYGDNHNGNQDSSDLLANDGSYKTDPTIDYPLLKEGNNIVYFRTIDNAGNISTSYNTAVIKLNTSSPTTPQNVTASPSSNTTNSFAFSWHAPASFVGPLNGLTYCYTVNALPTVNTCNYTSSGQTSLSADAFATQPGDNIFYVVAKDEAGNINYDTYSSVTFSANTPAPGIPLNPEIADISTKATQTWKLAFSWAAPVNAGTGVAKYAIYRSTTGINFSQVATTSGLSYVDSSLSQQTYYYKVKACDSANNCGAFSEVFSKLPAGRFTSPPELISNVSVEVSTRKATFNWVTDRASDSRIQYGTESGVYFIGEIAVSEPLKVHTVELDNLEAGTTYYYKAKWTDEDGNIGVNSELSFTTLPAPVVKKVEVIKKSLNSAIIQFTSTDATKVSLSYGKTEGFGGLVTVNTSRSESSYIVELTGLDDGSTYFYKLGTLDSDGNAYDSHRIDSFTTPPRPRITNLRFQPVAGEPTSTQKVSWTTNVPASSAVTYGKVGTSGSDMYISNMTTEHEVILRGLEDDSQYFLLAQSRDVDGNLATGDRQVFKTALDTRPPKITDVRVETSVKGNGSEARGQIIVSWKTDEPATSQVAYAYGSSGSDYRNRTAEDMRLSTDHIVIISDLAVSKVYHLQPVSLDRAQNTTLGNDQSAVIGRATESILNIILNSLHRIFGI